MPRTSHPWPTAKDMPYWHWMLRFGLSRVGSRLHQARRRLVLRLTRPPTDQTRFDVYGGTSVFIRLGVPWEKARLHLSRDKRVQMNSRLSGGRHAIMLDWDGIPESEAVAWALRQGGRWHLYRTERGFHFINACRTATYLELWRITEGAGFQARGACHTLQYYGHGGCRVSRKEHGRPDIFKAGVVGEGEELTEVLELIQWNDRLILELHGSA